MKNILICVLLFSICFSCKKQKNKDELQQFVGTWKITEQVIYFSKQDTLYSVKYYSGLSFDYPETKEIICEFKNNGFITFKHEKCGDERFRITGIKKITVHFDPNTFINGYNLELKNKIGKRFIFFIAMDPFTKHLLTVKWYKGRPYKNYDNISFYMNYDNTYSNDNVSSKYSGFTSRLGSYESI